MSKRLLIPIKESEINFRELKVEFVSAGTSRHTNKFEPKPKKIKIDPKITIAKVQGMKHVPSVKMEGCSCVIQSDCMFHTKFMEQTLLFQKETTRMLNEILQYCSSPTNSDADPVVTMKFIKKEKYFPIDCTEKFTEVNEMCKELQHRKQIIKKFSDLRGEPTDSATPHLMNRTFQTLFTDEFLDQIARSRPSCNFIKTELFGLLQEVWIDGCDNEIIATTEFKNQVKYCIRLAKNRYYKQKTKEAHLKFEEEYLNEDVHYEDDVE